MTQITIANSALCCVPKMIKLKTKTNYLIQINQQDQFYCPIDKARELTSVCNGQSIGMETIKESGFRTVEPGCIVTVMKITFCYIFY